MSAVATESEESSSSTVAAVQPDAACSNQSNVAVAKDLTTAVQPEAGSHHSNAAAGKDLTTTVAKHYNELQEGGLAERAKSRIFYMRNFNNWTKSVLINQYMSRVKEQRSRDSAPLTVLDLCSGKGGDLLKWKKAGIRKIVCADIAATSVEQCSERYAEMRSRERNPAYMFDAEFIAADCTKVRLKERYKDGGTEFDLVSCQFSFHYCFESLPQADMMIRNACECLKPGGYFIGTTPNSYELVKRARNASDKRSFGNEVYKVSFVADDTENLPLFGAKYDFHLEGVVDCPEFLVYFPAFEKLAEKYGMKLVHRKPFAEYFAEMYKNDKNAGDLLNRMQALEGFPHEEGTPLVSQNPGAYSAATARFETLLAERSEGQSKTPRIGTLSQEEWEALTVYTTFAFQKVDPASTQAAQESLPPTNSQSASSEQTHEITNAPAAATAERLINTPSNRKREHDSSSLEEGQIGSGSDGSAGEGGPTTSKVQRTT